MTKLITTSWDDGYPADFHIAELLQKYKLQGTFYIPKTNSEYEVMSEAKVVELARHFEIGGHTINHVRIKKKSKTLFDQEILACAKWLEELLGEAPVSFCFPGGVYNKPAIAYAFKAGFQLIRTTELLNPAIGKEYGVFPTTLQVYSHSSFTYIKHLLKRLKFRSLRLYLSTGFGTHLQYLAEYYLDHISKHGGCFHLWGHSWEIEKKELWGELEQLLKIISDYEDYQSVQNRDLLNFNLS